MLPNSLGTLACRYISPSSKLIGRKVQDHVFAYGANEIKEADTYKVNLALRNNVQIQCCTMSQIGGLGGNVDLLIGMGVISLGNFVVSTCQGKTRFSPMSIKSKYRLVAFSPSVKHRRFTYQHNNGRKKTKCPRGNCKDYKRCCANSKHYTSSVR